MLSDQIARRQRAAVPPHVGFQAAQAEQHQAQAQAQHAVAEQQGVAVQCSAVRFKPCM